MGLVGERSPCRDGAEHGGGIGAGETAMISRPSADNLKPLHLPPDWTPF